MTRNASFADSRIAQVLGYLLGAVIVLGLAFGIVLLVAWFGTWLLAVVTAGAVTLTIWQGAAGVFLLSLIGAILGRK